MRGGRESAVDRWPVLGCEGKQRDRQRDREQGTQGCGGCRAYRCHAWCPAMVFMGRRDCCAAVEMVGGEAVCRVNRGGAGEVEEEMGWLAWAAEERGCGQENDVGGR